MTTRRGTTPAKPVKPAAKQPASPAEPQTLAGLVQDPANRRQHPARNLEMIEASLKTVGAARSIVIDEHNEILAGNGVARAAAAAGLTKLQVVEADGQTIVAVRRRGLSAEQKRDLAIYDNRTGELAEWDVPQLVADEAAGLELTPFFSDEELEKLLPQAPPSVAASVANQVVPGTLMVIITCADEAQQVALLERFMSEGLSCKALIA